MARYRVNEYGEVFENRPRARQRANSSSRSQRPPQSQTEVRLEQSFWTHYWRCFGEMPTGGRAINVFLLWPIALAVIAALAAAGVVISVIGGMCYCLVAVIKRAMG